MNDDLRLILCGRLCVSELFYTGTKGEGREEESEKGDILGLTRRTFVLMALLLEMHLFLVSAVGGRIAETALACSNTAHPGFIPRTISGERRREKKSGGSAKCHRWRVRRGVAQWLRG